MTYPLRASLLSCSALAALSLVAAQADAATIRGRVVDQAKGASLPGATVRVAGSSASTTSATDGSFTIDNVAAGPQQISVDYVGYDSASATAEASDAPKPVEIGLKVSGNDGEAIVVTGTRLAEARALQTKQIAINNVEALYANDVGKLPDQNVAEAVRRLPGLSVANDQGEGRYVIIRGINPNLVNVTLNGLTLPAPEPDGRQVKLDDIPSALISAVVVTKSLTPDQDANAIGGEVDIRTLSAFDRNKPFFVDARGAYGRYKINKKNPYELDGQLGGVFGADDQFGAVISVNFSKRPIESENFQGSTAYNAAGQPDQYGLRDYNLTRKRIGAVGNFDWHPNDATKIWLRTSYSKFTDNEIRDQNRVDSLAYPTATPGTFTGRGSLLIRRREEKDNTKSAQLGGNFDLGAGHLDLSGAYTRAIKNDPLRSEFNFRTSSTTAIRGTYDLTQSPYAFVQTTTYDPTTIQLNSVNYDKRHAQEDLWQLRADYSLPVAIGDGSTVKAGAKYLNRHKTNNRDFQQFGRGTANFFASNATYTGDTDFYNGDYIFGPRIDYDRAQAYATSTANALAQSASNRTSTVNNSLVNDYDVREKISAGYVMATLKFGDLTVMPGVRVEHTKDSNKAKLITATSTVSDGFNSFGGKSYTDFFPGVNVRYEPVRSLVVRGAVTTAIGRPNYPDLAPFVSVDTTTSPVTITKGNPALDPYKAVNADLGIEYYLPGQGVLSVGLFYKNIDNPIYSQSVAVTGGTFAGQTFATANVVTPLNADKAIVKGIEFNAQTRFTFLPAPFDGFGVSANYTHISGHGEASFRSGNFPLFFQSKNIGTAQLFFEKYGFAARVAYSYRSKYLDALGATAATDQYTDNNGQLDVHASYQIIPQATVFIDGTNLNDAAWRRFIEVKSQLIERERYDYAVRGGVQVHF
jgi:TonB-dependent receptor